MPSFESPPSGGFVKMLCIGAPKTGKTCALLPLLEAGYTIRILDLDNNLRSLYELVLAKKNPVLLSRLQYISFGDIFYTEPGTDTIKVKGKPKAFLDAIRALQKWEDGSDPAGWGPGTILVIDTLSRMGDGAYHWAKWLNPDTKTVKHGMLVYGAAQEALRGVIETVTAASFATNVIVNTHLDAREEVDPTGKVLSYREAAAAVGSKLGPRIPGYFSTVVQFRTKGSGTSAVRTLRTISTPTLELATPIIGLASELPQETGLITLFNALKESPK